MKAQKRPGQRDDESAIEYLRRVANNSGYEVEAIWDQLPSVEACLEFYELWGAYGTDYWSGILECIADGDSPDKARAFGCRFTLR